MENPKHYKAQHDSTFDLSELFSFLWFKKIRISVVAILISVMGAYYIFNLPKIYSSSSTILLSDGSPTLSLPKGMADFGGGGGDFLLDTYIEFIRSRQFIGGVVDQLGLASKTEFKPKTAGTSAEYTRDHAIGVVLRNLILNRVGETYMLKVVFLSEDPQTAADVANFIGPAFFAYHADMERKKVDNASVWLNDQLVGLQTKLGDAEASLQHFQEKNQLIDVRSQLELVSSEIISLANERQAIDKALASARATLGQIDKAGSSTEKLTQIPWLMNAPMLVDLRSKILVKKQVLTELSKRYKSKHHKYIAAVAAIDALQEEQKSLLRRLVAGLRQDAATLEERRLELEGRNSQVREQHSALGRHELELTKLRREVESTQKLYEVFVSKLQETEMLRDIGKNEEFAVVDYAFVPGGPSKPRVALLTALVVILAFLASSGFWLVLHIVSDRRTRYRQLLKDLNVPLLAEIPKPAKPSRNKKNAVDQVIIAHNFSFSEAIRSLRTAIMVNANQNKGRVIAVSCIGKDDNKSNIAISLAESFCNLERTLLIDLELRRPLIARAFGLSDNHLGITDFIARRAKFSEVLHKEPETQLSVLPCGTVPNDPMLYLSRPRFSGFIRKLGVFYDRLIIDTAPVDTVGDTLVVAKYVDGLVLVCDIENVNSEQLLDAIQRLRESDAPLMGVVFNNVKMSGVKGSKRSATRRFVKKLLGY